ncbi:MAG: Bug family tripartite tricarboxylate transporter substrate binding protein [Burkholderiales bacterium]
MQQSLVRMKAVTLAVAAFVTCSVASTPVAAQDYPNKPLQMIVPFPPGSTVDIMARGFANSMDAKINQRVVVQNRPGAGMVIGMGALVQASADGYSILYSPVTPLTIQLHRMKNLPYSRDSATPVCQNFENLFWIALGPKSPIQSFQELIGHAKNNPGKLRYATPGISSSPHLAAAELWLRNGVDLTDVPYSGEPVYLPHLLNGDIDMGISTTTLVFINKLRTLAVFAAQRLKNFPNVPTVAELGHPILPSGYGGLFVKSGTPPALVARLEEACRQTTFDPAYRELSERNFQQSEYLDRAAFTARIDADFKSKASLIPTLKLPEQ